MLGTVNLRGFAEDGCASVSSQQIDRCAKRRRSRVADAFRARVIDAGTESFVFELTGASDKIDSFVNLMLPLGLVEVSRTGIVAIARGSEGM